MVVASGHLHLTVVKILNWGRGLELQHQHYQKNTFLLSKSGLSFISNPGQVVFFQLIHSLDHFQKLTLSFFALVLTKQQKKKNKQHF